MLKISKSNAIPWLSGVFFLIVISYGFIVFLNTRWVFRCLDAIDELKINLRANYSFMESDDHEKIQSLKKYFNKQILKYSHIDNLYLVIEDSNGKIMQVFPENMGFSNLKTDIKTFTPHLMNKLLYQLNCPVFSNKDRYISIYVKGSVVNFLKQASMTEIYICISLVFVFFMWFYGYRQYSRSKKMILNGIETEKILAEKSRIDGIIARFARSALLSNSIEEASVYASEATMQLIGGEYIFAGYIDKKTGTLNIILNNSKHEEILGERGIRKKITDFYGIWGKSLSSGKSFFLNSIEGDDARLPGRNRDYMAKSVIAVPALTKGKAVGIVLSANRKLPFSESDERSLKRISEIYAVCIQKELAFMTVKERERQFRLLFKTNPDAVIITSLDDDIIVDVNDVFLSMTGYKSEDVKDKKTSEISLWEDFDSRSKMLSSIEDEGKIINYETTFKFNSEKSLTVLVSASKIYLNGKPHLFSVVREIEKLKQIENSLRKEREFFSKVLETSPAGIMAVDGKTLKILHANQRTSEILGLDMQEIQSRCFDDERWNIRDFNLNRINKSDYISNLLKEKKKIFTDIKYIVTNGSGNRIYLSLNATPIFDGDGSLSMFVASIEDISQKVLSEKNLKEVEERLNSVIDSLPVILWAVSKKGIITLCRGMGLMPFGIKPDSLVGQSVYNRYGKNTHIADLISEGLKYRPFTKVIKFQKRFFQVTISPTIDNYGDITGISGVALDISRKVKMEEEQAILSAAVEHATESVIITDSSGKIIYVNPAFEAITGFSREEAVGQKPNILKSGFHDDYFYKELWTSLEKGKIWDGYLTNKAKDGAYFEEEASISPVFDRTGTIQHFVAVKRNVTQERKMEMQLRKAQKLEAIGTLAGGIAHDFNNILFPIIGFTELLAGRTNDKDGRYLDNILSAAHRAKELIHQILTFSRQNEETKKPVKIHIIVKEALKLLRASIPSIIDIKYEVEKSSYPVLADPVKIHQLIMNLGTNAYQSMEKNGGVLGIYLTEVNISDESLSQQYISSNTGEKYIKLVVSDTGEGINQNVVEKIFDPYFTTKPQGKGTGLGLSTVHGIVQSCNGYIDVQSEEGKGSEFKIYLPALSDDTTFSDDYSIEEFVPHGTEHILVVDDELLIVEVIDDMLNELGYKTTVRTGSIDALELFKARPNDFDLMVTDLTMPNMKGTELAKEIQKLKPNFPIIICSGFSEIETRKKAGDIKNSSFIMKPVLKKDLAEAVRTVLDNIDKK